MQIFFGLSGKLEMNALLVATGVGDRPPEVLLGDNPVVVRGAGGGGLSHCCKAESSMMRPAEMVCAQVGVEGIPVLLWLEI